MENGTENPGGGTGSNDICVIVLGHDIAFRLHGLEEGRSTRRPYAVGVRADERTEGRRIILSALQHAQDPVD